MHGGSQKRDAQQKAHPLRFLPVPAGPAHIVFSSNRDGDLDLYASSQDGRHVVALTRNSSADGSPVISPDNRWLIINRGGYAVLLSKTGRFVQRLGYMGASDVSEYVFSPDSRSVVLGVWKDNTATFQLERVDLSTHARRPLGSGAPLSFSPNSRLLAVRTDTADLAVVDPQTGARHVVPQSSEFEDTIWSPTSGTIAFIRRSNVNAAGDDEYDLEIVDAVHTGAVPKAITHDTDLLGPLTWIGPHTVAYNLYRNAAVDVEGGSLPPIFSSPQTYELAVSPDGGRMVYKTDEPGGVVALTLQGVRGDSRRVLLRAQALRVAWSPSGSRIAALATRHGRSDLLVFNVATAAPSIELTKHLGGGAVRPALSWSPNERTIALQRGTELFVASLTGRLQPVASMSSDGFIVGWVKGALSPNAPAAKSVPSIEVAKGGTLHSRGAIVEIAADGERAVALVAKSRLDCLHFVAWNLHDGRLTRLDTEVGGPTTAAPCEFIGTPPALFGVRIVGTHLTWRDYHCGNFCYVTTHAVDVVQLGSLKSSEEQEVHRQPPLRAGLTTKATDGELSVEAKGREIQVRRSGSAQSITLISQKPVVDLELTSAGLVYAFNTAGPRPGTLVFVRRAKLLQMLDR